MIKNGDDTNVLGTIATFAPRTDKAGYAPGLYRYGYKKPHLLTTACFCLFVCFSGISPILFRKKKRKK